MLGTGRIAILLLGIAATNESGAGNGAGGGGGNNEPAGVGADGVAILMWVQCTP